MNEIEEFLKRAAALRAEQAQQKAGPQSRPPLSSAPPLPQLAAPLRVDAEVMDAEVIEAEDISDDVAEHVARHLRPTSFQERGFRERAEHLAERVRASDEVIEEHLHQAFEHRLGSLGGMTERAEDSTLDDEETRRKTPPQIAPDLFRLLRSPQELRTAIILTELLTPPEHRW